MFKLVLSISAVLLYTSVLSQVVQHHRYEKIDMKPDDEVSVIPLKDDGIALIRATSKYKTGQRTWELTLVDTALQESSTLEIDIDNRNKLIGYEHSKGYCYFLFSRNEPNIILELITIKISSKEVTHNKINPELSFNLTYFNKVGENFILSGFVNLEPCVLVFNPKNENLKLVPGFFQKNTELIDVRVNQNGTFNTLLIDKDKATDQKIVFKIFDSSGNPLLEDILNVDDNVTIQTGISSSLLREDLLVLGTWGKRNAKSASGFYAAVINPFTGEGIKPIYFGQLEHYFDYLRPKRASALKLKTKQALDAGKIPSYTSYVIPYRILEHKTGFLLFAESAMRSSNTNQYTSPYPQYGGYPYYNPYGPYYPNYSRRYIPTSYGNNVTSTEEFKKIETVALNLDTSGNLVWDFSMKFPDIKMKSLKQLSEFHLETDSIHFMFKEESELKIKSISLHTGEFTERTEKIKLIDTQDAITSESDQFGSIENWYDNVFFLWGYESIYNRSKSTDKRRHVLYINKIKIE